MPGADDGEGGLARFADALEGGDDADDGAEEADEGCRASGRGEERHAAFELATLGRGLPDDRATELGPELLAALVRRMPVARLLELLARGQEDDGQGAAVEVPRRVVDLAESVSSIDLEKGLAIFVRGAQLRPLAHDDRDRGDGKPEQHQEDELDDETCLENQADQVEAHGVSPLAFFIVDGSL